MSLSCPDWRAYVAGCRCLGCRASFAAYRTAHRRQPTGRVDSAPARAHVAQLAAVGLGSRQIAKLAGVSARHVARLQAGQLSTLRPSTAAALLAVRPVLAHGATVAGTRTHRFIDSLTREGFTRQALGFHLGHRSQQLQLHRRVRVASALRVALLYDRLAGDPPAVAP